MTKNKNIETDLELFRDLINRSNDAIFVNDPQTGDFIFVNDKACASLGYERRELLDMNVMDIETTFPDNFSWQAHVDRLKRSGSHMLEGIHKRKNGDTFPVETNVTYVVLNTGEYMVAVVRDIIERKRAEEEIAERGAMLQQVLDTASVAIGLLDKTGRITQANRRMAEMFGRTIEELVGSEYVDLVHPSERETGRMKMLALLASEMPSVDLERLYWRKDGAEFWGHLACRRFHDVRGNELGLIGVITDIDSRKRMEEKLLESETRLNTILDNVGAAIFIKDVRYRYTYVNHKVCEIFGRTREEILGKGDDAFFSGDSSAEIMRSDRPVIERGEMVAREEGGLIATDGLSRTYWTVKLPLRDSSGIVTGLCGISTDITGFKLAEEKIRQSEEFIRNILDTVDEGFIVIDRNFRILTANKAYCGQVGEACDAVIGRHCYEISHKTLKPCFEEGEECAVRQVFETGKPHTALHKHQDSKGSILYVETKAFPIRDSTGAVVSVIETVNNITEKHLLEEEQLKTQKLEAIGTLAGGIAHDFNNLLQGIFGYISMAKVTLDQQELSLSMLEQAEKALHMSVNLTSQLLTFSKGGKPVKRNIHLQSVIENSVKFALSGSRAVYRITMDEGLWAVEADEGQIGQVIQNIVLNAEQAMPLGGEIKVFAKNVTAPKPAHYQKKKDGQYVEISVEDSGIGIPEQYLQKIFDPYFTTKDKGSGLGLATSYSIIRNHDGLIDVKSKPGEGTTFFVYLPAVEALEITATAEIKDIRTVRKARVLLMDDEDIVRNIAGVMIRSLGHEVELAENGEEAISEYRESMISGRPFDVVIMDLTIRGGMGGEEAIKGLLEIDPDIKAVVSSGYSDDAVMADYAAYGFKACLLKPYQVEDLRDMLNALLNG